MILPPKRPKLSESELREMLIPYNIDWDKYPLVITGIRGYYLDTMGKPGVNDRGIYDDALFIVTPTLFRAFNGNTDPSKYRLGYGKGSKKGMGVLKPGIWYSYRFDTHKGKTRQYPAICQRTAPVTLIRDGNPPYEDTGMFGANIHEGGEWGTSSEACQTIPPNQWPEFYGLGKDEFIKAWGNLWQQKVIPYVLMEA